MSGRHPFELYLLYLTLLVSVPILLGLTPRPGSVAELLPEWMSWLWALGLAIGSLVALGGIFLRDRGLGLIMEQLGLVLVGVNCLAYTVAAFWEVGLSAAVPAAIVAGYGLSCLRRYFQIQQVLDAVHAVGWRQHDNEGDS